MRLLFCLFADSVNLLPRHLFRNLIQSDDPFLPKKFLRKLSALFSAMAERDGFFGEHTIKYFNGSLFDSDSVIGLDTGDLGILYKVAANYGPRPANRPSPKPTSKIAPSPSAAGRCAWLGNVYRALDEAVFAAYGWPSHLSTQQILANLLALNHQRAAAQSTRNPEITVNPKIRPKSP